MALINSSQVIGTVVYNLTQYVIGNAYLSGLWFALIGLGLLSLLRIEFSIGVVALIPLTIGLIGSGFITPVAGGVIILFAAIVAGWNFLRSR